MLPMSSCDRRPAEIAGKYRHSMTLRPATATLSGAIMADL
jgi:hypothetical protein